MTPNEPKIFSFFNPADFHGQKPPTSPGSATATTATASAAAAASSPSSSIVPPTPPSPISTASPSARRRSHRSRSSSRTRTSSRTNSTTSNNSNTNVDHGNDGPPTSPFDDQLNQANQRLQQQKQQQLQQQQNDNHATSDDDDISRGSTATERAGNKNSNARNTNGNDNNVNDNDHPSLIHDDHSSISSGGGTDNASNANANTNTTNTGTNNDNSNTSNNTSNKHQTYEAKYEQGATELFLLIESCKWEETIHLLRQEPLESRVWVTSSGTENTVFSWSVWRRLPLHEACRRQPPPVVVYSLLSAYPESTMEESQFGELPLHAAVRCGACAEVVNCLLASFPGAVFARDNSGCTPLDILNGTGKMMDHDVVVAALSRTINILTKEEQEWNMKMKTTEKEFQTNKDKRRREYERIVSKKNGEIDDLRREIEQEKLATNNLAAKVIQTEKVVELKSSLEKRYQEKMKKLEEEIVSLKSSNASRKSKNKELEDIIRSDRKTIVELNARITQLQMHFTQVCGEEDLFVSTTVAKAEADLKTLLQAQMMLIHESERKKELLRMRLRKLGVPLPQKKSAKDSKTGGSGGKGSGGEQQQGDGKKNKLAREMKQQEVIDEPSDSEIAEKALAAAMAQLTSTTEEDF